MSRIPFVFFLVAGIGLASPAERGEAAERARAQTAPHQARTNETARLVELKGRVVCLAERMHREHKAELPTRHEHLWGFEGVDGRCFTILRGRYSEAIWLDERVRTRELLIKARLFPKTQILEIQSIRSVQDGVVQDLYYYCDVCVIKSVAPEPCDCCRGPVELVERPLSEKEE